MEHKQKACKLLFVYEFTKGNLSAISARSLLCFIMATDEGPRCAYHQLHMPLGAVLLWHSSQEAAMHNQWLLLLLDAVMTGCRLWSVATVSCGPASFPPLMYWRVTLTAWLRKGQLCGQMCQLLQAW
jgi:hypothetical protein